MATNTLDHSSTDDSTQEKDSTEQIIIRESPDLWLKDGNLIIRTVSKDSPPTHTLYKVHKHILALHCSVFASLFDGPHDALDLGSEHRDGVPVMDLSDDADDVRDFLKALYFSKETHRHSPPTAPGRRNVFPLSYHGILRLAAKFDAQDLRDLLVPLLKADWPSVLDEWEALQDAASEQPWNEGGALDCTAAHPRSAVNTILLATECAVPDVLPAAFYELASAADFFPSDPFRAQVLSNAAKLSARQLFAMVAGRASIRGFVATAVIGHEIDAVISPACATRRRRLLTPCREYMAKWWDTQRSEAFYASDSLGWLRQTRDNCDKMVEEDVCPACIAWTKDFLVTTREALWRELPRFFDLKDEVSPNWGSPGPAST
ncbi:hypothetical protein BV25DRAFT_1833474 [Artomyces pyxidatus]|uniref:Uncharacterized protein n=1 Tax=Artomyces pyxidatus TaxID=48021 RepID=A0ACB8SEZ1_9AGAM|nr:hypothetical protein BV25DRAFT_1833474 [Artomyces pyxidatus]